MSENDQARDFPQISEKAVVFEDAQTILSRWREIDISEGSPEPGDIQQVIKDAADQSSWPDAASNESAERLRRKEYKFLGGMGISLGRGFKSRD